MEKLTSYMMTTRHLCIFCVLERCSKQGKLVFLSQVFSSLLEQILYRMSWFCYEEAEQITDEHSDYYPFL